LEPGREMKFARLAAINAVVLILCLEIAAFALSRVEGVRGRFFSQLPQFLERLAAEPDLAARYADFLEKAHDAELGWAPRPSTSRAGHACDDSPVEYAYEARAARKTPAGYAGREILVFGDSYTHGDEVSDADSYPSQLSELLERPVVNYGVGGFGPLQAALRFARVAPAHPSAEFAVLGVMSENIYRIVNAYRPVYHYPTRGLFAFKPSLRAGELRPNPNAPAATTSEELLPLVRASFTADFFSKPPAAFPYLLALARGVRSPAVQLTIARRSDRLAAWREPRLREAMRATLERFVATSETHGMAAVIVWVPQDALVRAALRDISQEFETAFAGRATFVSVTDASFDWQRYAEPGCHPTRAGYGLIAAHVANAIRDF
jgi:hypothetical protein